MKETIKNFLSAIGAGIVAFSYISACILLSALFCTYLLGVDLYDRTGNNDDATLVVFIAIIFFFIPIAIFDKD